MKPKISTYRTASGPVVGFDVTLEDLKPWTPSIAAIREAVFAGYIVGTHALGKMLPGAEGFAPTQSEVELFAASALEAVRAGRLIDFGSWTNETIKYGGNRGGPLYSRGAIGHPFSRPYMFVHRWEGAVAIYMVNPLDPERLAGSECECLELQPITAQGEQVLMIGDRALLQPADTAQPETWSKYHCAAIPSVWRFLPGAEAANNGMRPENAAAGNVLDPLMTALLILSTRGIERERVAVSDKLQKARAKNGKPPIPPYERVHAEAYVTAISQRHAKGRALSKGGSHAAPIAHLRMGHPRTLASGVQTWVRDTLVNATEEARQSYGRTRSHYEVKS